MDVSYRPLALCVILVFIGSTTFMAYRTVQIVQEIPQKYYKTLPVSQETDKDNDGIADYIDDSDGDGIADMLDPTPYPL